MWQLQQTGNILAPETHHKSKGRKLQFMSGGKKNKSWGYGYRKSEHIAVGED